MVTKIGSNGANLLRGTNSHDALDGRGGNDNLVGLGGLDFVAGGAGDDRVLGGAGNDLLFGDAGNDLIFGGPGQDEMFGGRGNDTIAPGPADDEIIHGDAGFDFVSYASATSDGFLNGVVVSLSGGTGGGSADGHSYVSIEGVIGSKFRDSITIGAGQVAFGGEEADVIFSSTGGTKRGDGGTDDLWGDTGGVHLDIFILQRGRGADQIWEFDAGQDRFRIDGAAFRIGATLTANEVVSRTSGHAASLARPQFIYDQAARQIWHDVNGTGAGGDILIATFVNGSMFTTLSASWFDVT